MGAKGEHEQLLLSPFTDGLPSLVAAAHELKSPLALVRQLSLMLEDEEISTAEQKRMLRQITLTSEKALRLTSDLTRSVRLSDAMFSLEPINPQQLCEDVVHELSPLFNAHGKEIKLIRRKHRLLMVANRDLLRRVITNFGENALNYADGSNTVEIKIEAIDFGRTIRLGVRDYGPALSNGVLGLAGKNIAASLMPVQERPQSSGLGIYIAGQFAEAMNGKIGAIRHRDGATFYVDLQASRQLSLI